MEGGIKIKLINKVKTIRAREHRNEVCESREQNYARLPVKSEIDYIYTIVRIQI